MHTHAYHRKTPIDTFEVRREFWTPLLRCCACFFLFVFLSYGYVRVFFFTCVGRSSPFESPLDAIEFWA